MSQYLTYSGVSSGEYPCAFFVVAMAEKSPAARAFESKVLALDELPRL